MAKISARYRNLMIIISTHGWAALYKKENKKWNLVKESYYSSASDNDGLFDEWGNRDKRAWISIEESKKALETLYKTGKYTIYLQQLYLNYG